MILRPGMCELKGSLANFLHSFVQRRPLFFQTFIFDLFELRVADFEPLSDNLVRAPNRHAVILGVDQVAEDVPALLKS